MYHDVISVAETLWDRLVTGFGKLPGEIMSALSHLASDLFGLGKNAILALVHGAESLIGDVENIGSDIGHALEGGFKDALSIFSPSKVMYRHGQMVAAGVIAGVDSMHGQLEAASMRMASGISGAVSAGQYRIGAAAGGGSAPLTLQIEWVGGQGDAEFVSWLQRNIRVRGGDPRIITKKVKFA